MPITPGTRGRLTSGVVRVLRSGRHLGVRCGRPPRRPALVRLGAAGAPGAGRRAALQRPGGAGRCRRLRRQPATGGARAGGHVERRPDPHDGRAGPVHLTGEGARALAVTRALRAQWAAAALADGDEDDARLLSGLLERLAADLERTPAALA